jgi:hypothetical protein
VADEKVADIEDRSPDFQQPTHYPRTAVKKQIVLSGLHQKGTWIAP